jgi:2-polyprenyl-3-methyl-5-hydroxy-6-metoxy-1,4-benzoquinol methylase
MHGSVMQFLREHVKPEEIKGLELLEVGSQDVNGSPREVLVPHGPKKYVGVDFAHARGVDVVMDVKDLTTYFGLDCFGVVVSTEMLEHAQDWRGAVSQMKAVLRPGGLLIVTTRGPGFPFHGFPHDYWRYTVQDFSVIFGDMKVEYLQPDSDPGSPGVFLKARKTAATGTVNLASIEVAPIVA